VVIVRRTRLPPFGTSTVAVPLIRLIARAGAGSTPDRCSTAVPRHGGTGRNLAAGPARMLCPRYEPI